MEILGLDYLIWLVLVLYFIGMLVIGWYCRRTAQSPEGYLLGNRKFGTKMMIMHAFGAGTNPSDITGTISKTVSAGASGIWVSWMWMFGTPFYWIIAPVIRRMRCLTMADYFKQRFGPGAAVLYTFTAGIAMTIFFASVLVGTVRTVQGMMGPDFIAAPGVFDWWFYGILIVTAVTFTLYGYWGGIVAAIRTDMIQGLMIIALSIIALPMALNYQNLGGLSGVRSILKSTSGAELETTAPKDASDAGVQGATASNAPTNTYSQYNKNYLNLFDPKGGFSFGMVILLCISAPLTALALPHLVSVCGAGQTEWQGRMGITCGNILKRTCTIGWSVLGLCWLAYLIKTRSEIHPDAAFGDSIRALLPPVLQGVMPAGSYAGLCHGRGHVVRRRRSGYRRRPVHTKLISNLYQSRCGPEPTIAGYQNYRYLYHILFIGSGHSDERIFCRLDRRIFSHPELCRHYCGHGYPLATHEYRRRILLYSACNCCLCGNPTQQTI